MALLGEYTGTWTNAEASHLLRRAGFGGSPSERQAVVAQGMTAAVAELVDFQPTDPHLDGPSAGNGPVYGAPIVDLPTVDPNEYMIDTDPGYWRLWDLYKIQNYLWNDSVRGQWFYRMRYTSQPFQEQFALFLHDHAPSGIDKLLATIPFYVAKGNDGGEVPWPYVQQCTSGTLPFDLGRVRQRTITLLRAQIGLYRSEGLDSFENLLVSLVHDPAMLYYLDNFLNKKGKPQENFGREIMELFSLGVGHYSELDVYEVTKCLTGEGFPNFKCELDWDMTSGFSAADHEPGNKTVFGQTVYEDMSGQETLDVINLIVNKNHGLNAPNNHLPTTAIHIAWKILTWFVNHDIQLSPPDPIVLELADYLVGDDAGTYPDRRYPYDMKATMGKLFRSEFFYDSSNRMNMIKNPADYTVATLRALEGHSSIWALQYRSEQMGFKPYSPPNVSGWLHEKNWLASASLIGRYNCANYFGKIMGWTLNGNAYWIDALPVAYTDHAGMITLISDVLFHQSLTGAEVTMLTTFLDDLPITDIAGWNDGIKRRKIGSLIHIMMCMPAYQLK